MLSLSYCESRPEKCTHVPHRNGNGKKREMLKIILYTMVRSCGNVNPMGILWEQENRKMGLGTKTT